MMPVMKVSLRKTCHHHHYIHPDGYDHRATQSEAWNSDE